MGLRGRLVCFGLYLAQAAFGLALASQGATKPFPGFGQLMAGVGIVALTLLAADAWQDMRRREPRGEPKRPRRGQGD